MVDHPPHIARSLLAQAHAPWGDDLIGNTEQTIARVGCALTSMCIAARYLGGDLDIDPGRANLLARNAGAFVGASLLSHKLAPLLGLISGERVTMDGSDPATHGDVVAEVQGILASGGVCMLHVDTDEGRAGTKPDGNHYVVVVGFEGDHEVVAIDPAGGRLIRLDYPDLECPAPPGRPRAYRARGVRGLWRTREA